MKSFLVRKRSLTLAWGRSTSSIRKMPQSPGLVNKSLGGDAVAAVADAAVAAIEAAGAAEAAQAALGARPGVVATTAKAWPSD